MADTDKHYTRLAKTEGSFSKMMESFGVVTVMNADVYRFDKDLVVKHRPADILKALEAKKALFEEPYLCTLNTLKIANITVEGPSKTVSGGRYANPLIKFGKTARLEMQDALGNIKAIDALCGGIAEQKVDADGDYIGLHIGGDFNEPLTIIGDTFFISKETQQQVKVKIIFYKFLPDSIFNLTQDAEGDATVFDMNGDLLTTIVKIGSNSLLSDTDTDIEHGLFYSILDPTHYVENGEGQGGNSGSL